MVRLIFILEICITVMNDREKAIAYISGAISTYSLKKEMGKLENEVSMYDFLAKIIPPELDSEAKIELIDEVFSYISNTLSKA